MTVIKSERGLESHQIEAKESALKCLKVCLEFAVKQSYD